VIEALIRGESYPAKLAKLAHPRLKASPQELCEALRGPTRNRYAVDAAIARIIEASREGASPSCRTRGYDASMAKTGALDVHPRLIAPVQSHRASPTFSWAAG